MSDDNLDQLLREAGESFRATHTWTANPLAPEARERRAGRTWLPLAAAATSVDVVIVFVLALPTGSSLTTAASDTTLPMTNVDDLAVDDTWVVVVGGDIGDRGLTDSRIEVRRRDDLSRVAVTLTSSYEHGVPGCLALSGDWLLWTDHEVVDTDLDPGPPTRWSLWVRNLVTGEQKELDHGKPKESGVDDAPCPVAGGGWAAWHKDADGRFLTDGKLVLRELDSGSTTSHTERGTPVSVTSHGLVLQEMIGPGLASDMDVVLRSGRSFGERRVIKTVPLGTTLAAAGDTLVTIAAEAHAETSDGAIVSTCTIPGCADFHQLQRDPASSWPVVGDGFVAWSDMGDSPKVVRLDGRPSPGLAGGYSFFRTVKAWKGTLLYTTQEEVTKSKVVLHLLNVTG
jgi:hypothetical protein